MLRTLVTTRCFSLATLLGANFSFVIDTRAIAHLNAERMDGYQSAFFGGVGSFSFVMRGFMHGRSFFGSSVKV